MILIHIVLALASLGLASANVVKPAAGRLKTAYGLAAGTVVSGIALIFLNNASVLRTCLTGIVFFGIVSILNETARYRLAHENISE